MRKMLSRNQTIELVNEAIESGEIHCDPSTEVKVGDINSESATAGKVIVADGEGGAEWGSELPSIASGDSGKVLKVNAGETGVEWGAVSGGTQFYEHCLTLASYPSGYLITFKTDGSISVESLTFTYADKRVIIVTDKQTSFSGGTYGAVDLGNIVSMSANLGTSSYELIPHRGARLIGMNYLYKTDEIISIMVLSASGISITNDEVTPI